MVDAWTRAVTAPPAARYRVLVALVDTRLVGFAITSPSADPDADAAADGAIEELAIDPVARRRGHGSRLLNACADTLVADGFTRASMWVPTRADELRRFLADSGVGGGRGITRDRHRRRRRTAEAGPAARLARGSPRTATELSPAAEGRGRTR